MRPSPLLARFEAHFRATRAAIVDAEGTTSFATLGARALGAADVLRAGATSLDGARVALLAAPGAAWVEAFLGTLLAGGVSVPLSPLYPAAELAYFLDDAQVDTLVVSDELRARIEPVVGARRVVRAADLVAAPGGRPAAPAHDDDVALMLYTSGTTGRPKGAMITHANLAVQATLLGDAWGWSERDVLLHALPLHHLHGLGISLLTALFAGASARMLPRFDAVAAWDAMAASTVLMAVPTMYQKLLDAFDAADEPTRARWTAGARALRLATSGSAALPARLAGRWGAVAGSLPVERFGMTEIGVGMSNPIEGERRAGSVGLPLPTVELRLVGDDGRDAAPGEPGEIWVRGPSVFRGYFGRDEATRAAFTDGWFRSGDVAERGEGGYLRILGRTSVDILKSGGYKLSALEIEDALREHEAIAEVAVVGVPDETWGDRVVAVVVARAGFEAALDDEGAMRAWAKERLAAYKVPRAFVRVDALPRNAVGKVIKPDVVRALVAKA